MYTDAYAATLSEELLTRAAERARELVRGRPGLALATAAGRAVRSLLCPCVGQGCGCAEPETVVRAIVQEVAARAADRGGRRPD